MDKDEDNKSLHSDNSSDDYINEYFVEVFTDNNKLYECTYKNNDKEIITELDIERSIVDDAILKKGNRIRIMFNRNKEHIIEIFISKNDYYYFIDVYTNNNNDYIRVDEYAITYTLPHTSIIVPNTPIRSNNSWCSIM